MNYTLNENFRVCELCLGKAAVVATVKTEMNPHPKSRSDVKTNDATRTQKVWKGFVIHVAWFSGDSRQASQVGLKVLGEHRKEVGVFIVVRWRDWGEGTLSWVRLCMV